MNVALTFVLTLIVLWFIIDGLVTPRKIYEFPFLAGVMTFSFILPQLPALTVDRFLPDGAYAKTMVVTILCLLALKLGWALPARPARMFRWTFDERRLLILAGVFSAVGCLFYLKLSHLPGDSIVGVQMSGMPVIYLFFARLMTYGLVIATLLFARRPSYAAALIIGLDLIFYLERIVVTGKRAETMELVLIFCLAAWFQRRWVIPRLAAVAALLLGTFMMVSMSDYRDITRANSGPIWTQIAEIDFAANFETLLTQGGPEMRNAVQRIAATDRSMEFDYGKFHWNRLVFNYVPSQLVGAETKWALMLPMPSAGRDYDPATGTTETGMADAFQSFWYFGAIKFLILAYLVQRIWRSAMAGEAAAQIVYTLSIVPAMHAISHMTDWVVSFWVHMAIFLAPGLALTLAVTPRAGAKAVARAGARARAMGAASGVRVARLPLAAWGRA